MLFCLHSTLHRLKFKSQNVAALLATENDALATGVLPLRPRAPSVSFFIVYGMGRSRKVWLSYGRILPPFLYTAFAEYIYGFSPP